MQYYPTEIVEILSSAKSVVAITGSGLSAPSGIPTFAAQPELKESLTYSSYTTNPQKTWLNCEQLKAKIIGAKPNSGHAALVKLAALVPSFHLFTQNIDGLHQRAGSKNVTELHGSLLRVRCDSPPSISLVDRSGLYLPVQCNEVRDFDEKVGLCKRCGKFLRHDVVMYGESLGAGVLNLLMSEVANCDFLLIVGSSGFVNPVNQAAKLMIERRMPVIEVNLAPVLPQALTIPAAGDAAQILPALVSDLIKYRDRPPMSQPSDYLRM